MKGFITFLDMRRCKDCDYKICSWNICLKTCPTRLSGAQRALLHPEYTHTLRVYWRSTAATVQGCLSRGRWWMPLFSRQQRFWQVPICSWENPAGPYGPLEQWSFFVPLQPAWPSLSSKGQILNRYWFRKLRNTKSRIHTAHAKLLQSCPTLYDSMDCSPPCPSVHGILQTRILV